jgi:hypothetical protein
MERASATDEEASARLLLSGRRFPTEINGNKQFLQL